MREARFRPTRRQAVAGGLCQGSVAAAVAITAGLSATVATTGWTGTGPPWWLWPVLALAPPLFGAAACLMFRARGRGLATKQGIRTPRALEPWSSVVDLRAERRGNRTVVSVYLVGGRSVRLSAPYTGELFATDPQFDLKLSELVHLWRSHRFGGVAA
ncbi:hypothetical protein [Mangrovihabitans endophyticus]|nr:hypothetical protein [Mangrovihabitans endophyticus]